MRPPAGVMTPPAARLEVPFLCQWDLVPGELPPDLRGLPWPRAGCAIACATMILNHHGQPATMGEVLTEALAAGAFDPRRFWLHAQLVGMLRGRGVAACRRNWFLLDGREAQYLAGRPLDDDARAELAWVRRQMVDEALGTIGASLAAGAPVVASVRSPSGVAGGPGHQVLLVGRDGDALLRHDPARRDGAFLPLGLEAFLAAWKGTAILVEPPEGRGA
jgi:Peptidase_C39 like family